MSPDPLQILLVDDNDTDVLLTEMALDEISVPHRLRVARDGVEALELLRTAGTPGAPPRPDIILLDLNMPRMGGLEVLLEIKAHPLWRTIPVIVLTTSSATGDVWESYQRHANAYMSKPSTLPEFVENLRSLGLFWRAVARLSPGRPT